MIVLDKVILHVSCKNWITEAQWCAEGCVCASSLVIVYVRVGVYSNIYKMLDILNYSSECCYKYNKLLH